MGENFQSGKTQAIDLDELHVDSANRPAEMRIRGEFELDKWSDDPWASTEESRKKRRWADDERWSGDDEERKAQPEEMWDANEESLKAGWHAPKRGDVLLANEGWDDWDNFGGAPKELIQEEESKEFGGYRRVQAASQYAQVDTSNYVDGHAQRDDLYRSKEVFGTSGVRERKGDPYANLMQNNDIPMPEMKPVSQWDDEAGTSVGISAANESSTNEEDMRASAKISPSAATGDDIPGVTRASIIIFQAETEPVIFELKKLVTSIGRGLDNMVILNDQYASRRHLTINYVGGRFELFALSVDNIASVNSYPIRHIVLKNNDQIEVGATRIKFVLGPISDAHMTLGAPTNGRPMHLDPPPQEVRSPITTRKNLILLISVVSVIVFFVIAWLILMFISKSDVNNAPVAKNTEAKTEAAAEEDTDSSNSDDEGDRGDADEAEPVKAPELNIPVESEDTSILQGMAEAYSVGTYHFISSTSGVVGEKVNISVATTPPNARIYNQDGSLRGVTPYNAVERSRVVGEEEWIIRLDGYLEQKVKVLFDGSIELDLTLEPEPKPEPPKAKPAPAAKAKAKPKPKSQTKSKNTNTSGGAKRPGRIMI